MPKSWAAAVFVIICPNSPRFVEYFWHMNENEASRQKFPHCKTEFGIFMFPKSLGTGVSLAWTPGSWRGALMCAVLCHAHIYWSLYRALWGVELWPLSRVWGTLVPGCYEAFEHHVTGTQYKQHHIRVTNLSVTPLSSALKPGNLQAESELHSIQYRLQLGRLLNKFYSRNYNSNLFYIIIYI